MNEIVVVTPDHDLAEAIGEQLSFAGYHWYQVATPELLSADLSPFPVLLVDADSLAPDALAALPTEGRRLILGGVSPEAIPFPLRLGTLLDHLAGLQAPVRLAGAWQLRVSERMLIHEDGRSLRLTERETDMLACLQDAEGDMVSRESLLAKVFGLKAELETHTVETHIYRLRQKLAIEPGLAACLQTEEGGYRLVVSSD